MEPFERVLVGAGSLVGALFVIVRYVLREERTFTDRSQKRRVELEEQVDKLYLQLIAERDHAGALQRELLDLKSHVGIPEDVPFTKPSEST